MPQRVRTGIGGIGALILVLGISAALTAVGKRAGASQPRRSVPRFTLVVSGRSTYIDPRTQMRVTLRGFKILPDSAGNPPLGPHRAVLAVRVELTNANYKAGPYDEASVLAVQPALSTLRRIRIAGRPSLGSGSLQPGSILSRWIGFTIPASAGSYTIAWSDHKHLVPPVSLQTVRVALR